MRFQTSALLTALLLTVLAANLRHAQPASLAADAGSQLQTAQLQPHGQIGHRGSGRIEIA